MDPYWACKKADWRMERIMGMTIDTQHAVHGTAQWLERRMVGPSCKLSSPGVLPHPDFNANRPARAPQRQVEP